MRHLAIGDIHGCFQALTTLAAYVPFAADDVVITLGDYVNRGPDSFAVLDWLIARHKRDGLIPLRGNHEIMMLAARDGGDALERWLACGGVATLLSYSPLGDSGQLDDVPAGHWSFLENDLLAFHETASHFFVHANAFAEMPLDEQPDVMLYWEPFADPPAHESGKVMVCGHTAQRSGVPRNIGHAICIDTWAYGKGWLTCLDAATGKYWQANQQGKTRSGWLERLEET
jgi:serine/threonine protein phosphatase 1